MSERSQIEQLLDEGQPIAPGGRPLAAARRVGPGRRLTSRRQRKPSGRSPTWAAPAGQQPNWIVSAATRDLAPVPIVEWSARFAVPAPPAVMNNQIVYLFIGLQDASGSMILQPVLQWNLNAQFRNQWSVSSWFVRQGEEPKFTPPVPVQPGTVIYPRMRLERRRGSACVYECGFDGIGETYRRAADLPPLRRAVAALEAYWLNACKEYPGSSPATFSDWSLATEDGPASPAWRIDNWVIDCGQHAAASAQQIDLYCR